MKITSTHAPSTLSVPGILITLGIVFGAIGTSPLYVMKAVLGVSQGNISSETIIGVMSGIIWTLTIQTTVKYLYIILRADNRGEGGILALYALVRKRKKGLFAIAIIGASAIMADGILTPSITIVSAVEGLHLQFPTLEILPIALIIIVLLFLVQQFGTATIGSYFGPIMVLWFIMLSILGVVQIVQLPLVLKAFNPYYGLELLYHHPHALLLMGAVFLCTTGAEAIYTDLGHCGIKNIRATWIFVKTALILNYLGQGSWILLHPQASDSYHNPFFAMMPAWFLPFGVLLATLAAIIASQALISGSYTIISEAIQLNLWPKVRISYPTTRKGQMYISSVNWLLFLAVLVVVLTFRSSANMESAYVLSITVTMLMTTVLMAFFMQRIRRKATTILLFVVGSLLIEGTFLVANLVNFVHGGWFTLILGGIIAFIMFAWHRGRAIKNQFMRYVDIADHAGALEDLSKDETVPLMATNLVYITLANQPGKIETKILYSIFNKNPKRAHTYWLLRVQTTDEPHTLEYSVEKIIPGILIRVEFRLGFKVEPRINLYFKHILEELVHGKEINLESEFPALNKHHIPADFYYVIIRRIQNYDFDFPPFKQFMLDVFLWLAKISTSDIRTYGLDTSNVMEEKVPYVMETGKKATLTRIK
jgi:KUP system potassium uptake protein